MAIVRPPGVAICSYVMFTAMVLAGCDASTDPDPGESSTVPEGAIATAEPTPQESATPVRVDSRFDIALWELREGETLRDGAYGYGEAQAELDMSGVTEVFAVYAMCLPDAELSLLANTTVPDEEPRGIPCDGVMWRQTTYYDPEEMSYETMEITATGDGPWAVALIETTHSIPRDPEVVEEE